MKALLRVSAAIVLLASSASLSAQKPETQHLAFVIEYIRQLAAIENIRTSGAQELKPDAEFNDVASNAVYTSTRMQLELKVQIATLKEMRLDKPFEEVIPDLVKLYQQKAELWAALGEIFGTVLEGPKPNVDFGKLAATVPRVRATLDSADEAIFKIAPLIFAALIDPKEDSEGHLSHLTVSRAEREKLVAFIDSTFGPKLDEENQNFTVSAASVIKGYLLKDFKSSDDPAR